MDLSSNWKPVYWLVFGVLLHSSANFVLGVRWNNETCSGDNMMVTFSKCCGNEPYCSANKNEQDCQKGEYGLYCEWVESTEEQNEATCAPKPDERSDICCRGGAVKDACHSIAYKFECPKDWLVKTDCCPDATERKYGKLLGGVPNDMVCCNSPCNQVEKAVLSGNSNCTLSARCAPGPRSYAMTYNPYHTLGFYHGYRGYGGPHKFGSIIGGTGLLDYGAYGRYDKDKKHDLSKDDSINEITVDDLFELLIEALEDDTDVKTYKAELYTDPFFGRVKTGGLFADLNLPNPDLFLNQIYGSPYGLHPLIDREFRHPLNIYSSPYEGYGYGGSDPTSYVDPYVHPSPYFGYGGGPYIGYGGEPHIGYGGASPFGY